MVLAAVASLVARAFRQPLVIAYIVTGFLVGPSLLDVIHAHEAFESFSEIGIALLLFIIGLGLNVGVIKNTGKPVFLAFMGITALVGSLGLLAMLPFGFTTAETIILASSLLFSSTIIVIKVLSDKREQSRLYGQLAIGTLLVDDIAATLALLVVSAVGGTGGELSDIGLLVVKGAALAATLTFIGGYIMPKLSKVFASSQELLYIFAIAWAFGTASAFYYAGFSIEIGALFAGVALAHLPYVQAISTRLKPLRDFFIVLFFINLGVGLILDNFMASLVPAVLLSVLALTVKPLAIMMSFGWLGYTKQTSFKAAIHLSQISEFSVILISLAVTTKMVGEQMLAIGTLTALITIAVSTYLMKYDDRLYRKLEKYLSVFERENTKREIAALSHYPLVLIGYSEGGYSYVETFRKMKKDYVVIDFDPDVIETLEHKHIHHLYGDATDTELLEEIGLHKSELVISTLHDLNSDLLIASYVNHSGPDSIFICHATTLEHAQDLYDAGATYVLLPHFIGNEHINQFLGNHGINKTAFKAYRDKHLKGLGNIAVQPKPPTPR